MNARFSTKHVILCNGAQLPKVTGEEPKFSRLELNYLPCHGRAPNVYIGLPDFVREVYHLPDRFLDLLEIAAYVFAADRLVRRGAVNALEYHRWARTFEFVVRVRDSEFWSSQSVRQALSDVLTFMTGDRDFQFQFQSGHSTPPTGLFDREEFILKPTKTSVVLFSGGLDSLAGALDRLESSDEQVCLVSHRSSPGMARTQDRLTKALSNYYPGRVSHYRFRCRLRGIRAAEETQRTRSFLFCSIAFAIAFALSQSRFFIYENGVTSLNLTRREDQANARASRTTHPQTMFKLQKFFNLLVDKEVTIEVPFLWKTKTDLFKELLNGRHSELIPSSVSCSRSFKGQVGATHCGNCFQCVDRRLAAYAAGAEEVNGEKLYAHNFAVNSLPDAESKTTLVDYVRQAREFAASNLESFYLDRLRELTDIVDYLPDCGDDLEASEKVWKLCHRHGSQIHEAIQRIRECYDDPYAPMEKDSLLALVAAREYIKAPVERLVASITEIVTAALPRMFRRNPPKNEADLNEKLHGLIEGHRKDLRSEHSVVSFACANFIPDHVLESTQLLIESKYVRKGMPPSKASEGMAADLTKRPPDSHILFLVYDPSHALIDDGTFKDDFERKGGCSVCIIR